MTLVKATRRRAARLPAVAGLPAALMLLALGACALPPKKSIQPAAPVTAAAPAPAPVPAPAQAAPGTLPAEPTPFDLERVDIRGFIEEVSAEHGIPAAEIRALLAQGMFQPRIIAAITRPAESVLKWWQYSERLVSAERIARGVEFARQQAPRLAAAETATGVPAAYIAAIIGIETSYGRNKGSWRVLDALMTLGFDYPPRSRFFRAELAHFLLLAREESLDPLAVRGSYAGAMGAPQFMPSSYRRYAVNGSLDGAGNRRRDLFDDWDDVIGSVANYFVAHGWQRGAPVLLDVAADPAIFAALMPTLNPRNLQLDETAAGARARGLPLPAAIADDTRLILLPAELADRPNVRVGLQNFHVITRYNRSILYAMAVHDLATAIAAASVVTPVTPAAPAATPAATPPLVDGVPAT
jgi:membrane-bound lytic murein transglycosylase B